jgi:NAD(P)-dependent dehydrogenase (short-subunit alcohol dehydrogenase family)
LSTVLVTGTSSGFGELTVKTLSKAGHRVFATMRDIAGRNAGPAEALRGWSAAEHVALEVVELDVTSDTSVQAGVSHVFSVAGAIDVVVNNAGASATGPLEAFTVEQMAHLLNLNALGPMRVNKAVLPAMRERRSGLIIWITSTLGRVLPGRGGLYPATKWAAEGFAESLHHQIQPFGIDLTIIEPGAFPSGAADRSMPAAEDDIIAAYAAPGPTSNGPARAAPPSDYTLPDPQEVADAIQRVVDLPAGHRPLRMVVGPIFTEGVEDYNQAYLDVRAHMESVLQRPDQAITWTRGTRR